MLQYVLFLKNGLKGGGLIRIHKRSSIVRQMCCCDLTIAVGIFNIMLLYRTRGNTGLRLAEKHKEGIFNPQLNRSVYDLFIPVL